MEQRPHWLVILIVLALGTLSVGCARGYKSARALESDDRGPKACVNSCHELGLEMSGFVLVEHEASACVCAPRGLGQNGAAASAAAHVLLQQRAAQQQQQQQQQQPMAK